MRLATIFIPALVVTIGYGLHDHFEARQEWDNFERRFETVSIDRPSEVSNAMAISIEEESIAPLEKESSKEESITKVSIAQEPQEKPYQPTTRDPLHFIDQEVSNSPLFLGITDFELDELDLISESRDENEQLKIVTQRLTQNLIDCMNSGACIEELTGYYDDITQMRSHQLLERTLFVALAIQDHAPESQVLSLSQIKSLFELESSPLHYVAIEHLENRTLSETELTSLLNQASKIAPESRGHLFAQLEGQSRQHAHLREHYVSSLRREITQSETTAIEILKHLPFIRLDQRELTSVSQDLCQYRQADIDQAHQWEMIQFHHGQYAEQRGLAVDLSRVCQ